MVDEMIQTVKAALTPGADDATKQQAAAILRGLLGMLEPGAAGASPPAPIAAGVPPEGIAPALPDFLTSLIERVRPFLPADALADMPRFRVPLIDFDPNAPKK